MTRAAHLRDVLIVTQYFPPEASAPSVRYRAIIQVLNELGIRVQVLTGIPNYPTGQVHPGYRAWQPRVEWQDGVTIRRLPLFPYGGSRTWLRLLNHASFPASALAGMVLCARADLVIVESPPLPLVLSAAAIARLRHAPLVMFCADLWPGVPLAMGALRPGFVADRLRDLETICYRLAWRVTVPTEGLRASIAAHPDAGPEKVLMLPNGFDPDVFRPYDRADCEPQRRRLDPFDDRALFVYAGTIGHAQSLQVVLEVAELTRGDPRIGFALIGDGPERGRLQAQATDKRLDNIRFIGAVPPEEVARYLAFARATIVPLRDVDLFRWTRPAKVPPSLACGVPVVFAGRGETAALLERERCGIVVPPEDATALAAAISELAGRPEAAREMGARGRTYALRELAFPVLVRRWLEAVSTALPPRGRSS